MEIVNTIKVKTEENDKQGAITVTKRLYKRREKNKEIGFPLD